MLSTEAIQWCIENCSAYVYGDEAKAELRALISRVNELEAAQPSATACDCGRTDGKHDLFCAVQIAERDAKRRR